MSNGWLVRAELASAAEANVQWSAHAETLGEAKSELEQQMEALQGKVEAKEQACVLAEERACSATIGGRVGECHIA